MERRKRLVGEGLFRKLAEEWGVKDVSALIDELDPNLTLAENWDLFKEAVRRRGITISPEVLRKKDEEMLYFIQLDEAVRQSGLLDQLYERIEELSSGVVERDLEIERLKREKAELEKQLERAEITREEYERKLAELRKYEDELKKWSEELAKLQFTFTGLNPEEIEKQAEKARKIKPKPPEVKVLPEVPEKCPLDGLPLSEVSRVPIGPVPIRLSAEEEHLRARLGLPIPEREMVWLDVPVTMKVYACPNDHMFERDPATGRLVQRTPEYIYRKIIRETAALRRIVYAPEAVPAVPYRVLRPPAPPAFGTQELFWAWLETVRGINRWDYLKLSEAEKKRLVDEWVRWRMGV